MNPSTSFVRPAISSLLVTSSLMPDFVNSICLPWDLPLSAAPHSMGPSLDTLDRHVGWRPQLVLGSHALIETEVESHKCYGTRGKVLVASYSNQSVTSSFTPFPLYICHLSHSFLLFAIIFKAGFRLHLSALHCCLLQYLGLAITQIALNAWRIFRGVEVLYRVMSKGRRRLTVEEFFHCYSPSKIIKSKGIYSFLPRKSVLKLVCDTHDSNQN